MRKNLGPKGGYVFVWKQ